MERSASLWALVTVGTIVLAGCLGPGDGAETVETVPCPGDPASPAAGGPTVDVRIQHRNATGEPLCVLVFAGDSLVVSETVPPPDEPSEGDSQGLPGRKVVDLSLPNRTAPFLAVAPQLGQWANRTLSVDDGGSVIVQVGGNETIRIAHWGVAAVTH